MKKNKILAGRALVALVLVVAESSRANEGAADFALDELMQTEVSSVSRKTQSLADTAAAAFVISQEDIRRSGATSIAEALRLAPGLQVARISASSWAITSRGFNGRYANKLLVLMDGRTVYTPQFSGVFWGLQDTLMEDIDRIEVIRGPGAAMWGANAVNGVINIITKKARDTQGNLLTAGAGNQESDFAGFRHGGKTEDTDYRVYAKGFERDASVSPAGQKQGDSWGSAQTGFRMEKSLVGAAEFTLQGDAYRQAEGNVRTSTVLAPQFYNNLAISEPGRGPNLLGRLTGYLSGGSEYSLQTYYDHVQFASPITSNVTDTVDIDFQHRIRPNLSHDVMWGANARYIHSLSANTPTFNFSPANASFQNYSIFAQDDISLQPDLLRLTLGAKVENTYLGGTQYQPNARLLWTPNETNSVWVSASKATRTPAITETQLNLAIGTLPPPPLPMQLMSIANNKLAVEKVTAYELGYRAQWTPRFSTDLATFVNYYKDNVQWVAGVPAVSLVPFPSLTVPFNFVNSNATTKTYGMELSADWRALDWMRLTGYYTGLKMETPAVVGINFDYAGLSPHDQESLRAQMDLNEKTQFDLWLRHVGKLSATSQSFPAYNTIDARLGFMPRKGVDISLVGQNLLGGRHSEYMTPGELSGQIPRSAYIKATINY